MWEPLARLQHALADPFEVVVRELACLFLSLRLSATPRESAPNIAFAAPAIVRRPCTHADGTLYLSASDVNSSDISSASSGCVAGGPSAAAVSVNKSFLKFERRRSCHRA